MARTLVVLSWSGGKDSVLALVELRKDPERRRKRMQTRWIVIAGLIGAAAATRLLPHPPNVTPIAAMALFGGAHLADRRLALLVPLAAMLASDLVLGLHALLPVVYGAFALIVWIGTRLAGRITPMRVAAATLAGSLLFFVVTNFGVWALGGLYPRTAAGLVAAYVAAIPFFRNTLLGDAAYALLLFGGYALLARGLAAAQGRTQPGRV
ncbi:MAG: DUF6580 family putative transport protein [Armatimonadota bacterium]|nr:DUF6580 family putative transport protein [Armatimonadota bacterium]